MSTINVTNFRNDLFKYLEKTIEYNDVLKVSTKKGNAVIISESDYDNMLATLEIMSNKETLQNVINGLNNIDNPDYWIDESEVGLEKL